MVDIHSHLIPGVDDGAKTLEASIPVLQRFGDEGVEVLVCTPHLVASEAHIVNDARYQAAFDALVAVAPAKPRLLRGWEIMLDRPGVDLTSPMLRLGGSSAVLVEFPRMNVPRGAREELFRIRASGVVPVLAHPERYWGCTAEAVAQWRGAGAVIQLDAAQLLGGGPVGKLARQLLEEGLVDCVASDNHGDVRSLAPVKQWFDEMGAGEQGRLLTHVNADRLLRNEPVLPVTPLPKLARGVVSRFKELLLGRR